MRRLGAAAAALLAAAGGALAESRGAPAGRFDFYVLALSWSPGFCEAAGDSRGFDQCARGSGQGFVVHGLWPQFERGYPSSCEPGGRGLPRAALDEAAGLFPDEGLARHEWRKHGSCSGLSPTAYFREARRARALVQVPEGFAPEGEGVRPLDIERAFAAANPGLRPEMMAVQCGRRVFQEIRICLTRDLRGFRACPEVDRDSCRAGAIAVPPVR